MKQSNPLPAKRGSERRKSGPESAIPPWSADAGAFLERRQSLDRRQHGYISRLQLFSGIPYHLIEDVLKTCPVLELASGEVMLTPGQRNDSIYLLLAGGLQIHLGARDTNDFIVIGPGECIGELSIIDGKPVSAYVVAETACRVLIIHEAVFWGSIIPIPEVARNLMIVLSERMRLNNKLILERLKSHLMLEHLQKELQVAKRIQASMLPSTFPLFPERADVDIFAVMDAAKDIGGDFFDAFFVKPDRLFIGIGDVSGKGIPAALFMARSMTQLRMEALRDLPPDEILARVNSRLCENNESGMFVTLFCGILDLQTGDLRYSNAGHNPPLADAAGGSFDFIEVPRGTVVGIMEDARFECARMRLQPGQTLMLYTDGVTEAMNPRQELYSEERFRETLSSGRRADAKAIIEAVRGDIDSFAQGASQSDDITMLALRYLG